MNDKSANGSSSEEAPSRPSTRVMGRTDVNGSGATGATGGDALLSLREHGLSSVPLSSRGQARFYQDRVAYLGRVLFSISLFFLLQGNVTALFVERCSLATLADRSGNVTHGLGTAFLLAMWLAARTRRRLSHGAVTAIDLGGIFLATACFAGLAVELDLRIPCAGDCTNQRARFLHVSMLAIAAMLTTRALLVPSTPRASLVVSSLAVAPVPLAAYVMLRESLAGERLLAVAEFFGWCVTFVTIATVASRVLYGLRERVREARELGQYTLEARIGQGGMGEIYRARHAFLRRPTAVKLLPTTRGNEARIARFEREVQATAKLTHPHTIQIFDYGRTPDGVFYYAMEYLDGIDLEHLVEVDGPQSGGRVIHLLRQVCGALAEAHDAGLIHRDVKPANIYVCTRGGIPDFVKVLDFGLVTETGAEGGGDAAVLTGTPLYMSPEAIRSESIDARSDLYALGAVAYYLLTGRTVFQGETIVEVCAAHLDQRPEPPSTFVEVAPDLSAVVLACLAKDPDDRPRDARDLSARLAACEEAGAWTDAEARQWWRGRARARASLRPSLGGRTLDVDLEDRTARAGPAAAVEGRWNTRS